MLEGPRLQTKLRIGTPGDVFEQEADRVARSIVSGSWGMNDKPDSLHFASEGHVQRKCDECEREEETLRRSPKVGADRSIAGGTEGEQTPPATTTVPESSSSEPPEAGNQTLEEPMAESSSGPALLVEDEAEQVAPGQMRKTDFLVALRGSVCTAANDAMAGTGQTTENCPWMDHWFEHAAAKDTAHIARAIRKYAPAASGASTAQEYIPIVTARVRQSVEVWVKTGQFTGLPEGVSTDLPGATAAEGETAELLFKARPGGPRRVSSSQDFRQQLGGGRPLPGAVRSRMEAAFGLSFSSVRIHTDARAGALSDELNARAFTIGDHVAFGRGEYQPGTLVGDALLAHELAHVVQQGGSSRDSSPMRKGEGWQNSLEQDADRSAVGAVVTLWGEVDGTAANLSPTAPIAARAFGSSIPRQRTSLGLQRCSKPAPASCPKETITMSGAKCGRDYGAVAQYCYEGASNWWFKEHVVDAPGAHCQSGGINQTTNPIQSPDGCVADDIADRNGPPSTVAPCVDKTLQTVFAGPTRSTVEQCKYDHEQLIEVTAAPDSRSGEVKTTTGGVSTDCHWTA